MFQGSDGLGRIPELSDGASIISRLQRRRHSLLNADYFTEKLSGFTSVGKQTANNKARASRIVFSFNTYCQLRIKSGHFFRIWIPLKVVLQNRYIEITNRARWVSMNSCYPNFSNNFKCHI